MTSARAGTLASWTSATIQARCRPTASPDVGDAFPATGGQTTDIGDEAPPCVPDYIAGATLIPSRARAGLAIPLTMFVSCHRQTQVFDGGQLQRRDRRRCFPPPYHERPASCLAAAARRSRRPSATKKAIPSVPTASLHPSSSTTGGLETGPSSLTIHRASSHNVPVIGWLLYGSYSDRRSGADNCCHVDDQHPWTPDSRSSALAHRRDNGAVGSCSSPSSASSKSGEAAV